MSEFKYKIGQQVTIIDECLLPQMWEILDHINVGGENSYTLRGLTDGNKIRFNEDDLFCILID